MKESFTHQLHTKKRFGSGARDLEARRGPHLYGQRELARANVATTPVWDSRFHDPDTYRTCIAAYTITMESADHRFSGGSSGEEQEGSAASGVVPRVSIGGVNAGDLWTNAEGRVITVTWVRRIGVIAYRSADDRNGQERVTDIVRFLRCFRPCHRREAESSAA
jgi:hypothetical protein